MTSHSRSATDRLDQATQVSSNRRTRDLVRWSSRRRPSVDVVVPVYNEEVALEPSVVRLHHHLTHTLLCDWRIVIADNASTDATAAVAEALARVLPRVSVLRLARKGRGLALRAAWSRSVADVVCYMDVDLSTDLRALNPLLHGLLTGHGELAIGTRLAPGARVVRSLRRELISRGYNLLLRAVLEVRFSDAQCGFKAVRGDVAKRLLPEIRDDGWFFDTELLVLAQRRGMRIIEVPVDWTEDPDSRVKIIRTALADLRGVTRLAAQTAPARVRRARSRGVPTAPRLPPAAARTRGSA